MTFFVKLAIRNRCVYTISQNGSNATPSVVASSQYREMVLAATVVRKLASYFNGSVQDYILTAFQLTVFKEASIKPCLRPCIKVSLNLSCTSPLSIPRTRRTAFSRGAQLCSVSLPWDHVSAKENRKANRVHTSKCLSIDANSFSRSRLDAI